jgi:hypothetical protein
MFAVTKNSDADDIQRGCRCLLIQQLIGQSRKRIDPTKFLGAPALQIFRATRLAWYSPLV